MRTGLPAHVVGVSSERETHDHSQVALIGI